MKFYLKWESPSRSYRNAKFFRALIKANALLCHPKRNIKDRVLYAKEEDLKYAMDLWNDLSIYNDEKLDEDMIKILSVMTHLEPVNVIRFKYPYTQQEIAKKTGINPSKVYRKLTKLRDKGLIFRDKKQGKKYLYWKFEINEEKVKLGDI